LYLHVHFIHSILLEKTRIFLYKVSAAERSGTTLTTSTRPI